MKKLEEAKKEKEIESLKMKNAKDYYERGLMINYVLVPLG
jgi:hypothetical protein